MKKQLTRSDERMHSDLGWLNSRHSFSFGGHVDPERMGFGPLRVVNDDVVAPGKGFGTHPHRDMEIVSLVLSGQLEHKDSMGNGRVIQTGDIQYMSAGTGVEHSEFNPSSENPVHFMQIWIEPRQKGLPPRYADQPILGEKENEWKLLLSPDGRDGSIEIRQDAELYSARITPGTRLSHASSKPSTGFWVFVIDGQVDVDGDRLGQGDSSAIQGPDAIQLENSGNMNAKVLLFEVSV